MFLFASGRTDIPAFYWDWFMKRMEEGFVDVRNPYYHQQVTRYLLNPQMVDCLVFCSKNPGPALTSMDKFLSFNIPPYFFVTITPYEQDVEEYVPEKSRVMDDFIALSQKLGKDRVCWRYDPIFISEKYSVSFHIRAFRAMAEKLSGYTDRCIISFVDLYEKTKKNFPQVREVSSQDQIFLAQALSRIGDERGIKLETCAEKADFRSFGIEGEGCINRRVMEKACGFPLAKKIPRQSLRQFCNCLPTKDIGYYNSCPHLCRYCYANYDAKLVEKNYRAHDPTSTFMIGGPLPGDQIHQTKQDSWKDPQLFLL